MLPSPLQQVAARQQYPIWPNLPIFKKARNLVFLCEISQCVSIGKSLKLFSKTHWMDKNRSSSQLWPLSCALEFHGVVSSTFRTKNWDFTSFGSKLFPACLLSYFIVWRSWRWGFFFLCSPLKGLKIAAVQPPNFWEMLVSVRNLEDPHPRSHWIPYDFKSLLRITRTMGW